MNLEKLIKAYALKNALEFDKAEPGKILPKLFKHGLEKKDIPKILPEIKETVNQINKLTKEQKEKEFSALEKLIPEKQEQREGLPELPNPKKKMVFRLAPYPSGALHIGNARTFLLNALYAEKYEGKVLLVMDDTIGSEEKQISKDAYKLIEESLTWLKIKYAKPVVYKSDRLEIYYKHAEELIKKNKAYVCECPQEKFKSLKDNKKDCPCRNKKNQLEAWKKMFKAKPGETVLRIKTSMQHPDPAFRDRVLFKISDRTHPRTKNKYKVWPALEMSWAIDDHLLGVTHIIRGTDLAMETEMEKFIWDIFKWTHPTTVHNGPLNLEGIGAKISKSKAQKEVQSGKFIGWSDPRTWSIQSLKRRGIKPEAIREFVESLSLSQQNITAPVESLYSINRKIIDPTAKRFSFVENPVELKIKNAPIIKKVKIPIHPDKKPTRELKVNKIFISKKDFEKFKGQEIRLLHLYNIKLSKNPEFTSKENKNIQKINWVSEPINCEILQTDGKTTKGLADPGIKTLKKDEVLQFERYGFVKLDKKQPYQFWFTHK